MIHWARVLVLQAWGPELESPGPSKKLGMDTYACNLSMGG